MVGIDSLEREPVPIDIRLVQVALLNVDLSDKSTSRLDCRWISEFLTVELMLAPNTCR